MKRFIEILKELGAAEVGFIPYKECEIINPALEKRMEFVPKSVIICIVPYYTHFCDAPRSISAYALSYDYHKNLSEICQKSIEKFKAEYPNAHFAGFVDHSPINEKLAAAKASLGIIGDHSLLITKKFSSFVFLFEIITDLEFDVAVNDIKHCEHCGACKKACPSNIDDKKTCLSAITQRKGTLGEDEIEMIRKTGYAWGCDICQLACPHTIKAINNGTIYTDSLWFNSNIIPSPDENTISNKSDFSMRAYSWRGKQTILRNISLLK